MRGSATEYSPVGGAFRGPSHFSPARILGRIGALQLVFYGVLSVVSVALHLVLGHPTTALGLLAVPQAAAISTERVIAVLVLQACASCVVGLAMGHVVGRSRLCADYGSTLATLYLVVSLIVRGRPRNGAQWLVHTSAWAFVAAPAVLVGRRACVRAELLPITLGRPVDISGQTETLNAILRRTLSALFRRPGVFKNSVSTAESVPLVSLR